MKNAHRRGWQRVGRNPCCGLSVLPSLALHARDHTFYERHEDAEDATLEPACRAFRADEPFAVLGVGAGYIRFGAGPAVFGRATPALWIVGPDTRLEKKPFLTARAAAAAATTGFSADRRVESERPELDVRIDAVSSELKAVAVLGREEAMAFRSAWCFCSCASRSAAADLAMSASTAIRKASRRCIWSRSSASRHALAMWSGVDDEMDVRGDWSWRACMSSLPRDEVLGVGGSDPCGGADVLGCTRIASSER